MEELTKAVELALIEFKKQNGEDAELEDVDWFVAEFNNATMILSIKDGNMDVKFSPDKPIKVDYNLGFYKECGGVDE